MRVTVRLFAMLRERAGTGRRELDLPDGATAGDVWAALELGPEPDGLAVAVNREYAERSAPLAEGDEVALIPPVSGGAAEPYVELTADPLDLMALVRRVEHREAGAVATFTGTVREHSRGQTVVRLDYEAYAEMVVEELRRVAADVAARHDLLGIAVAHRHGTLDIGDASVAIATSAVHRAQALAACQETIDTLKARAPIWKKEHYEGGAVWIGQGS
jgi:molybdopterin synthase catalytic subunit